MSTNCIILYGNDLLPLSKSAGPFRIKTELEKNGYTVQCIDISIFKKNYIKDLKNVLKKFIGDETLWVGISTTFLYDIFGYPYYRNENVFEKKYKDNKDISRGIEYIINFIKNINPNIKFIAGGSRRFMLENFGFKIFKMYVEKEIIEYTDYLAKKTKKIDLKYFNNTIEGTEFSQFNESKINYSSNDIIDPLDVLPIEISRGCIFKCKFCAFPLNGKTKGEWVKRTNVLLEEFKHNYENFGVTNYLFSDDTYNDSADKVKLLYDDVFSKLPFKINFTTYIRVDLMMRYPETVEYLKQSGLKSAVFGIETINHDSGKTVGKGVDPKIQFDFLNDIKKNQFKKIFMYSGFILGLPKDTPDDIFKLEEFIFSDKNPLDDIIVEPLYIKPKIIKDENRYYYSTFDLEYDRYGYECYEKIESNPFTEVQWKNHINKMTFEECYNASRILNKKIDKSDKFKFGGWAYSRLKSIGVREDDIFNLSRNQIREKYNIDKLVEEKAKIYVNNLLTIDLNKKI